MKHIAQFLAYTGAQNNCQTLVKIGGDYPQNLAFDWGGPNDEGFSYTGVTYSLNEEETQIEFSSTIDGQDCDGRLQTYIDGHSMVSNYQGDIIPFRLDDHERSQRDRSAEAMNY